MGNSSGSMEFLGTVDVGLGHGGLGTISQMGLGVLGYK